MIDQMTELEAQALAALDQVTDAKALEAWRVEYLGRSGKLTQVLRGVGKLPAEERPRVGQAVNELKARMETALAARQAEATEREHALAAERERVDVTLPGRAAFRGSLHPITQTFNELIDILALLGFQVATGPEVELDYYNFEMLNIPPHHPARDMWSTFFISDEILLRTHTSPVQIRAMQRLRPPIRVIAPGRTFRYEATDATHEMVFNQLEGLAVDEGITMGDLKGVLTAFAQQIFGQERKTRFVCSYFPFVEPGMEMAIDCYFCQGRGCRICKGTGWIELLGAGMVHPKVLRNVGIDPERYSGFAFGMGVDRIAILKHGVNDIRLFNLSDLRFLRQFAGRL